jgi:signal transduction histidine kinase
MGFRGKLVASYFCAALVLMVGLVSFMQMQLAEEKAARADHRRKILRVALEIRIAVLDAEAAQRGFLLTRDPAYLDAPVALDRTLEDLLRNLEGLAAGYPVQAQLASNIIRNTRLKMAEIDSALGAALAGRDPLPILRRAHNQPLAATIARDAEVLFDEIASLRDAENAQAELRTRFAKWFLVLGNMTAFVLAVAVTFWIGKAFSQAQQASLHLAEYNKKVEEHARRLAAQEQLLADRLIQERQLSVSLEGYNQALARSNADLEQFAYVASHDLRAPLRGIASLADWLEEDLGEGIDEGVKKHLDTLRGRVRRLDALISGIAVYSRAGRRPESVEVIDVAQVLRDVVDLAAPDDGVEVAPVTPLPVVRAPRTPFQQIFLNLISNAIKHGGSGGRRIEVGAADEGDAWCFTVRDFGPGIAPEYHEKIFGLFQRLASRDRVEGTGIGLALVKKLVERYGGKVWVESAPGEGAAFSFTWPKRVAAENV